MRPLFSRALRGSLGGAMLLVAACGGGGSGTSGIDVTLTLPITPELQSAINAGTPVTAEASVDGGTAVPLTVSPPDFTATLSIAGGSAHTVQITCYVSDLATTVQAAQGTVSGYDPDVDGTALTLAASALTYTDTDSDGYTNLVEMALSTLPDDATSHPTQSGTLSDATGTVRLAGTAGMVPATLAAAGAYGTAGFGTMTGGTATLRHH